MDVKRVGHDDADEEKLLHASYKELRGVQDNAAAFKIP